MAIISLLELDSALFEETGALLKQKTLLLFKKAGKQNEVYQK
jgi:hypothetical protein